MWALFFWVMKMTKQINEKNLIKTEVVEVAKVAEVDEEKNVVEAVHVLAIDEHAGKGGSYIFNSETGKRTAA